MLMKAGLGAIAPAMLAGNGRVSGTPQHLAKKPNICAGARPRVHYHYFTKDGRFGSLDWNEEPVDTVAIASLMPERSVSGKRCSAIA